MAVLGIVGLFMAAGARDDGVYVFGLSLFAFALLFISIQIRQGFDAADRAAQGNSGR